MNKFFLVDLKFKISDLLKTNIAHDKILYLTISNLAIITHLS